MAPQNKLLLGRFDSCSGEAKFRLDYFVRNPLQDGHSRFDGSLKDSVLDISRVAGLLVPTVKAYRPGGAKASHRVADVGDDNIGRVAGTGSNTRRHNIFAVATNSG